MSEQEVFVPIGDVAKHFGLSVETLRLWLRKGRIPKHTYIKVGTTYRFKISAVEEALLSEKEGDDEHNPNEPMKLY